MKFSIPNLESWAEQVRRRSEKLKQDLKLVTAEEIRFLLEYAVRFTPPKNLAQGRKAVRRDILRTMRPLLAEEMTESPALARIVKRRDIVGFNHASANFQTTLRNVRAVEFEARIHRGQQDSRKRVRPSSMNGKTVLLGREQRGILSRYIAKVSGNVGIAKAGWWPALKVVGGRAAEWVTRHGTKSGQVIDNLGLMAAGATEFPHITLINNTGWGAREGMRILNDAARLRTGVMRRKINKALEGMNQ